MKGGRQSSIPEEKTSKPIKKDMTDFATAYTLFLTLIASCYSSKTASRTIIEKLDNLYHAKDKTVFMTALNTEFSNLQTNVNTRRKFAKLTMPKVFNYLNDIS